MLSHSKLRCYRVNRLLLLMIMMLYTCSCSKVKLLPKNNDLIPRTILLSVPDKSNVQISSNGQYISYINPINGIPTVCFSQVENAIKEDFNRRCIDPTSSKGIRSYVWSFCNKYIIYGEDIDGSENTDLYAYDINAGKNITIFSDKGSKAFLAAKSSKKPHQILIGTNKRNKKYFDIYSVNLDKHDGKKYVPELLFKNDRFLRVIYDRDFNIRLSYLVDRNGRKKFFKYEGRKFHEFFDISAEEAEGFRLLSFNKNNTSIYVLDNRDCDTNSLKELELSTGQTKVITKEQKADLEVLTTSPIEKNIQVIRVNYDMIKDVVIDDSITEDVNFLNSLNKGVLNFIQRTQDDKLWLVSFISDIYPTQYYLYKQNQKTIEFLFSSRPELSHYKLLPMKPVIIKSRDSLNLVSYITLPDRKSKEDRNKLPPLIIYVHGGPHSRDIWGYNMIHQWMANRGYAVLSVNFRGSKGFGKKFLNAGNGEWGKKMHDDIIDAVNWAISNKIADPSRIAIMGASYGGYEVLISLTVSPNVFAGGIDIFGPSDLVSFIQNTPAYWKPSDGYRRIRIGDVNTKAGLNQLRLASPITFTDNIIKPLLIAQGENDPRVKRAQSDQIVSMLQKKNKPVIYTLYPNEGHGFKDENNKLSFYAIAEQFLARILNGKSEPIGKDLNGSNIILNNKQRPTNEEVTKIINKTGST